MIVCPNLAYACLPDQESLNTINSYTSVSFIFSSARTPDSGALQVALRLYKSSNLLKNSENANSKYEFGVA